MPTSNSDGSSDGGDGSGTGTVSTSIFLTIYPNQLSDIALILKTATRKAPSASPSHNGNDNDIGSENEQEQNGDTDNDNDNDSANNYHEAVITNNDLLQAKNRGKVRINNSPSLRVYQSYRNESIVKYYNKRNSSSKLSYPSLLTLVIPAVLLLSAVLTFFIVVDDGDHGDDGNDLNSNDSISGNGNGTCGSDVDETIRISGWDAIFPSYHTSPIVLKLTVWGTLIAIVAYEQSHFWYGSSGGSTCSDYYYYGNDVKPIGVEVIVDYPMDGVVVMSSNSNSITSINSHGRRIADSNYATTAASITSPAAAAAAAAGDTDSTARKPKGLTIQTDRNTSSVSSSLPPSTKISETPKRSNTKCTTISSTTALAASSTSPSTSPSLPLSQSMSTSPNIASPKKQSIPPIQKAKSEDPPESIFQSRNNTNTNGGSNAKNITIKTTQLSPSQPTGANANANANTNTNTTPSSKTQQTIPFRFIRATKGDINAARTRWSETLAWRKDLGMDTILSEPHPKIHTIKRNYPHYFHLRGKKNECCYYEKPPKMNLTELRKEGVDLEELLRHYALCCEFMWTDIDPSEEGKSIYVIDLDGIGLRDFAGDVVDFVKRASSFTGDHYPERSGSIYVINVPSWFSVIWNVVKPMVDDVTKKKITIMRYGKEAITKALMEKIDIECIPPEYGGKSMPLGQSPEELKFMEHFAKLNNGNAL